MGRWDKTANKASIKTAGATARSTKWYIVNDQMVNELIFDILDYRKKSSFLPKLLRMCKICCTFAADFNPKTVVIAT